MLFFICDRINVVIKIRNGGIVAPEIRIYEISREENQNMIIGYANVSVVQILKLNMVVLGDLYGYKYSGGFQ